MKQVRVEAFGDRARLHVVEVAPPVPSAGEVLLGIDAIGLNYADVMQREGLYLGGPRPPFVPGLEAAGVVIARGDGVTTPALGSRVIATARGGLMAEQAAVPATSCLAWPEPLDLAAGAAFATSYLTAYHALVTVARVRTGERVLVHAAAGGLGTAAVQIAAQLGLGVVGTASTADKRARVQALAPGVTAIDYADVERAGPFDIVLESIGGDTTRTSLRALAPLGRLVLLGLSTRQPPVLDPIKLLFRSHAVLGFHLGAIYARPDLLAPSLAWLLPRVADGTLAIQVGHRVPLDHVRDAYELLESRRSVGKVVVVTVA